MSIYNSYSVDQVEELLSRFLIDSWSHSKVATFSRNEKVFEKEEIYNERGRRSATSIAGNAYHEAVAFFFDSIKKITDLIGHHQDVNYKHIDLIELQSIAYNYIDSVEANKWNLQKTTPTVEEAKIKATKSVNELLKNFVSEKEKYINELDEVIGVELKLIEWLTINGVDIPLPCHGIIDLIIRLKNGKVVIIDHKTKSSYSDEKEAEFVIGKQAITYVKLFEAKFDIKVDEVWFIENKASKNKDGSEQLHKIVVEMTDQRRKLYEALLYEPLKRMIEAVSDPDYIYMINDSDNMVDKAELYDFWCKTLIAEVSEFDVKESKKEMIEKRLKKIRDASLSSVDKKLIINFKQNAQKFIEYDFSNKNMTNKEKIEHVLRAFGIITNVAHEINGYSSDTYLLEITAGVAISNIYKYRLDIANALNVNSVRIGANLSVYKGKSYLSIESSKKRTEDLFYDKKYLSEKKIPIGINNYGETIVWDIDNHSTPHVLICGATGSGKSVCILSTIEYAKASGISDIVVFDPKYEFCKLEGIRVINDIDLIEEEMRITVSEMQKSAKHGGLGHIKLIVFDEFADVVSSAKTSKELSGMKTLEENLKMVLQKGRSLGYRVVAATQRASTKVITGDAKVNFPVQICFRVPKEIDSKVVIDEAGAESLSGRGDGLMRSPEYFDIVRFQGFYKK